MIFRLNFPLAMLFGRMGLGAMLVAGLAGCMMNAPPSRTNTGAQSLLVPEMVMFDVRDIQVTVPRSLTVSEANTFRPKAKIVWHGDPPGDRHQQVEKIVRDAMQAATVQFRTGRPVVMQVEVIRFHALTPKTRLTFGGMHDLEYKLTLRDATNGEVIKQLPYVEASVWGAGGEKARQEEEAGRSEKVVIQEALMASIAREMVRAGAGAGAAAVPGGVPAGTAPGQAGPAGTALARGGAAAASAANIVTRSTSQPGLNAPVTAPMMNALW